LVYHPVCVDYCLLKSVHLNLEQQTSIFCFISRNGLQSEYCKQMSFFLY